MRIAVIRIKVNQSKFKNFHLSEISVSNKRFSLIRIPHKLKGANKK